MGVSCQSPLSGQFEASSVGRKAKASENIEHMGDGDRQLNMHLVFKSKRKLSSCESGGLGSETRRHVSNFTRSIARLSGKPTSSWSLVHHDQLQICKGLKWQHPAATVISTNMHRYNTTNMTFDDTPSYFNSQESFGMDSEQAQDGQTSATTAGRSNCNTVNSLASFAVGSSLDPSAGFPGLGELPSAGMESGVEHGSFTGDLNASAYDVGEDHSQLLQDMLQQQAQAHQSGQSPQVSQTSAWEDSVHVLQEMLLLQQQQQAQQIYQSQAEQVFSHAYPSSGGTHDRGAHHDRAGPTAGYSKSSSAMYLNAESELLTLLQLPRSASIPSSGFPPLSSNRGKGPLYSSSVAGPVNTGEFFESRLGLHHGSLHHGASQTAASFFHSLPRGDLTGNHNSLSSSLLSRPSPILLELEQERDGEDGKQAATSPFGLKRGDSHALAGLGKGEPRGVNHFATERQRREFLNEKYQTLRSLVPNPTKADRASIVADAIEYVKELKRDVQELQLMLQEKRRTSSGAGSLIGRKRSHHSMDLPDGANPEVSADSTAAPFLNQKGNEGGFAGDGSHLRSSWLQRTSQTGTQVDVRIVHDEVTIKLTQRRRKNCLLDVFGVLQELRLEVLHASGASVGEHDVFLFNTKILEGPSTFAGYIAAKMLEAVDHRPLM